MMLLAQETPEITINDLAHRVDVLSRYLLCFGIYYS
jgi:hypothetical protein